MYPVIEGPNDDQPELDFPAPQRGAGKPAKRANKAQRRPSLFERPTLKAATQMYEELRDGALAGLRLGLLHGRLSADDKEIVMRRFQRGELDVLVSTTVIEVGVDVPNATVMVIEHAERFGLAQMHQLRGRVGRGSAKSYCILMTGGRVSPEAEQRLDAMVRTQDGFELAELDLQLRGPGEFFGTRQAGLPDFRVANLVRDRELLELAKREAAAFVASGGAEATEAERACCGGTAEAGLAAALWSGGGRMMRGRQPMIVGTGIDMVEIERMAAPSSDMAALPGARLHRRGDRLLPAQAAQRGGELCRAVCCQGGCGEGAGHRDRLRRDVAGDGGGPRACGRPLLLLHGRAAEIAGRWACATARSRSPTQGRSPGAGDTGKLRHHCDGSRLRSCQARKAGTGLFAAIWYSHR